MKSLVAGRYHYIKNGDGREELYNFESDPAKSATLLVPRRVVKCSSNFARISARLSPVSNDQSKLFKCIMNRKTH